MLEVVLWLGNFAQEDTFAFFGIKFTNLLLLLVLSEIGNFGEMFILLLY